MNTIVNDSGRESAKTQKSDRFRDDAGPADDGLEPDFKPLTPEQAARKVITVANEVPQLSVLGIAGPGDCYPDFAFGRANQRIITAMDESAHSGQWVEI